MKALLQRWGGLVVMLGSALWMASELVEIIGGGLSAPSMAMLIGALFLLALGVWSVHLVQAREGGWLSLVGTIGISVGSALLAIVDILGWGQPTIGAVIAAAGGIYPIAVLLTVLGSIAFGSAVVRAGVFSRWAGAVAIIATIITLLVEILGLPEIGTSLANFLLNGGLIALGWQVWLRR